MSNSLVMKTSEEAASRYNVALFGDETGEQFSMRVQDVVPGQGTPLHIHHEQAETFHVIEGSFRFQAGDEEVVGEAGFTVHIPKGTPHCFLYENIGQNKNGKLMSILTPGIHDGFIRDIPKAEEAGVSKDELIEIAEANGAEIVGPKLVAR